MDSLILSCQSGGSPECSSRHIAVTYAAHAVNVFCKNLTSKLISVPFRHCPWDEYKEKDKTSQCSRADFPYYCVPVENSVVCHFANWLNCYVCTAPLSCLLHKLFHCSTNSLKVSVMGGQGTRSCLRECLGGALPMTGERLPRHTGPALLEPPGVHITKQNSQHVCCLQDKTMPHCKKMFVVIEIRQIGLEATNIERRKCSMGPHNGLMARLLACT